MFRKIIPGLLICLLPLAQAGAAAPQVVASIKPIHSLVANVMQGSGEPTLLIPAGASPHTYSLKPSEVARLHDAQLLVWIGPQAEQVLAPTARSLETTRRLRLVDEPGLTKHAARKGGTWERRHPNGHEDHPDHETLDSHIWLDPDNARVIVQAVARELAELAPENAERYRKNAEATIARLDELDAELDRRLAVVRDRPYIVFHDAYQYFEKHYGLNGVGSIMVDPGHKPGIRRVIEMRDKLGELGAVCVFAEPQFEPKLVHTILEDTDARAGTLDPLGARLPAGPEAYFQLLENLADSMLTCMKPAE